jgi:hypothetical protein
MAESTLSVVWQELQGRIGSYLGWGSGAFYGNTAWTSQQQFEIDGINASGLRQFYFPPATDISPAGYNWDFLTPVATIDWPLGTQIAVALPDDFSGAEGPLTVLTVANTAQPWQVEWRSEAALRQLYGTTPSMIGPPMFAALVPVKGVGATQGQRSQLMIFPLADQDYTLQFRYYILPNYLSTPFPYAYGGAQHSETILESCLAIAETRLDDSDGVHQDRFMERLKASIAMDRKTKPQRLGYNRDRSDEQGLFNRGDVHYWAPAATYNGNPFN